MQRHGGDLGYQYVRGYFGTIVFHVILVTELGGLLALLPMPQAQRNQTDSFASHDIHIPTEKLSLPRRIESSS